MYNRILPAYLPKIFFQKEKVDKNIFEYYGKLIPFVNKFIEEYNDYIKSKIKNGFDNFDDKNLNIRYLEYYRKLIKFTEIVWEIGNKEITINEFFKSRKTSISRSWFFEFKKKVNHIIDKSCQKFADHLFKSRRPNKLNYHYTWKTKIQVCNEFFRIYNSKDFFNMTTFWMNLRKGKIETEDNLSHLSFDTLTSFLQTDDRYGKIELKYTPNHPIRTSAKPIGEIQLDIKELGYDQSGTGKHEFIIDAICVGCRITKGHVLYNCTVQSIMEAVTKIKNEFEKEGIIIHTIQTDNAMTFKRNNFVVSDIFNEWCDKNHIKHRFIPKRQPECNGCIERFHKTYDMELVHDLLFLRTTKEIEKRLQEYYDFYNHERYHFYVENKHLKIEERYMIPSDALKYFMYNQQCLGSPECLSC